MATPKKYFQDHFVLLLLSINAFLAIAGSVLMLIRLSTTQGSTYIVQCRDCSNILATDKFTYGSVTALLSFIAFAVLVLVIHTMLSLSAYKINRHLAVAILALGILLLVLTIIVSNALLVLR
jgi:hypothetical protein